MDRAEYKAKIEDIRGLIDSGKTDDAYDMLLAENWKKVPNVNIMMQAGELFAACKKYDEAKELLVMAHERSPIGRMIIFKLVSCEVALNDLESAEAHYKEFTNIAPHDDMRYILRYRINKASGADDNTLIGILFTLCYAYQFLYIPLVWILQKSRKTAPAAVPFHRFAVLICARNEAAVIGDLIDSLKAQTYPSEFLHVFVMADNCTDETASAAASRTRRPAPRRGTPDSRSGSSGAS